MRVHRNCCGLDVHKKMIAACLIREDAEGNSVTEKRLFGSMTRELHALAQWLCAAQVTAVAMEATGVYWMPVWNVLEPYGLELLLINPEHYKAVRGMKTDLKDGTRIAELLQDGRLEGSYVPPVAIRVLRDLTRYRTKLVQYQSSIANRIQKLLEQGNIKLASVVSDALGVSAMAMLRALAQGETDAARMADMAKRQLRKKIPELQLALEGCLLPHHRWLLSEMIEDLDHVGAKIARIEETIEQQDATVSARSQQVADGSRHQTSRGLDPGRRSWSHGRSLSFCGRHGELGRRLPRQQPDRRETEERHHARR